MSVFVPEYYNRFKCSPSECKKNCCIGWEIDIDDTTALKYANDEGVLKDKLKKSIKYENGCYQFILDENERCPFLNQGNLCEIILNYGEESLCEICSLHPRFRNFIGNREEVGLGLTCEVAGKLILNDTAPFRLIKLSGEDNLSDEELSFINYRNELFEIAGNRNISLIERIEMLKERTGVDSSCFQIDVWIKYLLNLEILDDDWLQLLKSINSSVKMPEIEFGIQENRYENLLMYFIYRQFTPAFSDEYYAERLAFCIFSVCFIKFVCDCTDRDIAEISGMYSSEIEYSDENIYNLLDGIAFLV